MLPATAKVRNGKATGGEGLFSFSPTPGHDPACRKQRSAMLPLIVKGLRAHGGRRGMLAAAELLDE